MRMVNNENLSVGDMKDDLLERKALPIGKTQFDEWADRIIKAAAVDADYESLKLILAERIQHIGPTEAFKEDAYFVLQLRTIAVKETAFNIFQMIKKERDEKKKLAEATAPNLEVVDDGGVLANKTLQSSLETMG